MNRAIRFIKAHATLDNAVLVVAFLIAASWVWNTIVAIQRNFKLQQQVDILRQEIAVQELENKTRRFQNKYYESAEYQELSARERLNKAAPGEKVIILPPNTVHATPTQVALHEDEQPITTRSNFAQWMYFLFGDKG